MRGRRAVAEAREIARIDGDQVCLEDGTVMRLLRCRSVDVRTLDAMRLRSAVAGFERLLRSLECELHVGIHMRPVSPADVAAGLDDPLSQALDAHWMHRLESASVLARTVVAGARGEERAVRRQMEALASALQSMGIASQPLDGKDLRAHLVEVAGAEVAQPHFSARRFHLGETPLRTMTMSRLPGTPVAAGWLAPLLGVTAPCDIGLRFVPEEGRSAIRLLSRRMRDLGAHRLLELDRGAVHDAHIASGYDAAGELRQRLARNAARPLRMAIVATSRGGSEAEWQRLGAAFASTLGTATAEHFSHAEACLACWGLAPLSRPGKLVDSEAAATCIPFLSAEADDGAGYRVGGLSEGGLPVRLDPFDTRRYSNANIGIFAASGQGKSFLIGGLVLEARRHGTEVVIVDPEGEYRSLVEGLGGRWLDLVSEAAINPFDIGAGDDAPSGVVDTCGLLCGGLTDIERVQVEAAARGAISDRKGRAPLLRDSLPALERSAPRVAAIVERFLNGALRGFLDRPTSPDWDLPLIAIGHREIRDELIPVTTMLLGRQLWNLVRNRPQRRHIVLDEAGMLSGHPALRGLLGLLARRCRKYGSSLVVATQNVNDLLRSDDGQVVAGNCAVVLCGGHRSHEAALMERTFGLTEAQRRFIEAAPRGRFLLVAGDRRLGIEVSLPPLYRRLITGEPAAGEVPAEPLPGLRESPARSPRRVPPSAPGAFPPGRAP